MAVKWVYPIPAEPANWVAAGAGKQGVCCTPIIYQGIAYWMTFWNEVYAVNLDTGASVWVTDLPFPPNDTISASGIVEHYHNGYAALTTNNIQGGTTLWIGANNARVYAIDALTGVIKFNWLVLDLHNTTTHFDVPGNLGHYGGLNNILIDQQRGILVSSPQGEQGANNGRGVIRGWDITQNPPKMLWQTFTSPPQDGSGGPTWTINQVNSMQYAYTFGCSTFPGMGTGGSTSPGIPALGCHEVNLKTTAATGASTLYPTGIPGLSPSVQNSTLYDDWGIVDESAACKAQLGAGHSTGGTGSSWGAPWVLDEKRGVAYIGTNNNNPWASPCYPGPDLWSVSLLSVNMTTGALIWGFQTEAHELWDNDCSFNQGLMNETVSGVQTEMVTKTCKNGFMYQLNAATGLLNWFFTPPQHDIPVCKYCSPFDPLNRTEMMFSWAAPNGQTYTQDHSVFENDFAYDPTANIIAVAAHWWGWTYSVSPINASNYFSGNQGISSSSSKTANTTAYGINAATGQELWHYFYPNIGYRGGVTTSGGVVYLSFSDGYMPELNIQTGALIQDRLIGGPLNTAPAIGQTTNGQSVVLVVVSTAG